MKRMKLMMTSLAIVGVSLASVWAHEGHGKAQTLKPGRYTATVAALVCDACGPKVQQTLESRSELQDVSVDQKAKTVAFTVKPDAQVKVTDLQKSLKAAAQEMGMGADYHLKGIKKAS